MRVHEWLRNATRRHGGDLRAQLARWGWPVGAGLLAMIGLGMVYLAIITVAESWSHAAELLRQDALLVAPILVAFGSQIGLLVALRRGLHLPVGTATSKALAGTGGAGSTVAMVACCAHHVTDVLPFVGLSAAAVFLAEYKTWLMLAGLATNLVGIGLMVRLMRRERLQARMMTERGGVCHA